MSTTNYEPVKYPTFQSIIDVIKDKDNDTLVQKQIAGIKAWLMHKNRTKQGKQNLICYIKFETNRGYFTIGREVPELKGRTGKTINKNLYLRLNEYDVNPLLIFADPYEIRVIDHETFYIKSFEFQQQSNNEIVMAIDKNELIPWDRYMDPTYRQKRKPEDKHQRGLDEF